jgi:hypothetical protein
VHSQRTFIHVDQNIFWRDAVGPLKKNRPGLQAPKQKLLQKQAPKKGAENEP